MKKLPFGLLIVTYMTVSAWAQAVRVVNAASFKGDATFSPGTIITIFGSNLTNVTATAPNVATPPTTLGGLTLTIGGVASPLFYVSPTQVNAQIDTHVATGTATVTLTSPTGTFTTTLTISAQGQPGIFTLDDSGTGDAAVLNGISYALGPFSVQSSSGSPTFLAIFGTGINAGTPLTVTIGGVNVPVIWAGNAPGFTGLQQINVQLPPDLDGAGRVELTVNAGGNTSNSTEVVLVANRGPFPSDHGNQMHSRELSAIAWVPGTSEVLVTDVNDAVVRVIDVKQKTITHTIDLNSDAEPVAVAVNSAGTLAVVAERGRGKVAILDLTSFTVKGEVAVGSAPVGVSMFNDFAEVVNQQSDSLTAVNTTTMTAANTIAVGHAPRGAASDVAGGKVYVTNEGDGTISVINSSGVVTNTIQLGANARPTAIQVLPALGVLVVAEPSAGPNGQVALVNIATGTSVTLNVNPDRSGGSSDIAVVGNTLYFANQTGGSVSIVPITQVAGAAAFGNVTTVKADLGARALAVDTKDNLLLVTNEGSGTVSVIDLSSNQVVAKINAVSTGAPGDDDNHDDRDQAANAPTITSLSPASGKAGTFTLTINGTNLGGATSVAFYDPAMLPGNGHGHEDPEGPPLAADSGITTSAIQVNSAGTQLTVQVTIAAGHAAGTRLVRVVTPNGDTGLMLSAANTFTVTQ